MKSKSFFTLFLIALLSLQFVSCTDEKSNGPSASTHLWPAKMNGKWGFIDAKGNMVINAQYDDADYFSCGLADVKMADRWWYINTKGVLKSLPSSNALNAPFYNNYAVIYDGNNYGIINTFMDYVMQPMYAYLGNVAQNGWVAFSHNGYLYGYKNVMSDQEITPSYDYAYDFVGSYAVVYVGGKYGVINSSGSFVLQPIYDHQLIALGNNRFGFAGDNGYYGLLDESGNVVVQPIYANIVYISGIGYDVTKIDWYPVQNTSGQYGYIDASGNEKLAFQYDDVWPFVENLAFVKINEKWLCIDKTGNVVYSLGDNEEPKGYYRNGLVLTYDEHEGIYYYKDTQGHTVYMWTN